MELLASCAKETIARLSNGSRPLPRRMRVQQRDGSESLAARLCQISVSLSYMGDGSIWVLLNSLMDAWPGRSDCRFCQSSQPSRGLSPPYDCAQGQAPCDLGRTVFWDTRSRDHCRGNPTVSEIGRIDEHVRRAACWICFGCRWRAES